MNNHELWLISEVERLENELAEIHKQLPHFKDGPLILHEGPCYTPDGRLAYIEPFSDSPMASIKWEDASLDEVFEAENCFSTLEAAQAVGKKSQDEPIMSCDHCGVKIHADEDVSDGLCYQCAWLAEYGEKGGR